MLFLAFDECHDDIHATVVVLLGEDAAPPGIGRIADIAHNLSVFAHNHLIYIKRNTVFMQKMLVIHCRLPKSSYLCIVNQR